MPAVVDQPDEVSFDPLPEVGLVLNAAPQGTEGQSLVRNVRDVLLHRIAPNDWKRRISVDPEVHHGDACISGTRVPVHTVVGSIRGGESTNAILRSYPQLSKEDIHAALYYVAEQEVITDING